MSGSLMSQLLSPLSDAGLLTWDSRSTSPSPTEEETWDQAFLCGGVIHIKLWPKATIPHLTSLTAVRRLCCRVGPVSAKPAVGGGAGGGGVEVPRPSPRLLVREGAGVERGPQEELGRVALLGAAEVCQLGAQS